MMSGETRPAAIYPRRSNIERTCQIQFVVFVHAWDTIVSIVKSRTKDPTNASQRNLSSRKVDEKLRPIIAIGGMMGDDSH